MDLITIAFSLLLLLLILIGIRDILDHIYKFIRKKQIKSIDNLKSYHEKLNKFITDIISYTNSLNLNLKNNNFNKKEECETLKSFEIVLKEYIKNIDKDIKIVSTIVLEKEDDKRLEIVLEHAYKQKESLESLLKIIENYQNVLKNFN